MQLATSTFRKNRRSALEDKVAKQLDISGVTYAYESVRLDYKVPSRKAKYTPDFILTNGDKQLIIEAKGWFRTAAERQKMVLVKQCNPDLDIRIVFQNANKPIYKGSPTSYAKWATENGFLWADKGTIPDEWLEEVK